MPSFISYNFAETKHNEKKEPPIVGGSVKSEDYFPSTMVAVSFAMTSSSLVGMT